MKGHIPLLMACFTVTASATAAESQPGSRPDEPAAVAAEPATTAEQANAAEPYQALLQRSPFLTLAYLEQQRRGRGGAQLAFHGYFRNDDDTWMFSIFNQREKSSQWVTIGDSIGSTTITAFDPDSQQLTIVSEETTKELPLSRPEN